MTWISSGGRFDGLPTGGSAYDERLALLDAVRQVHAEVSRVGLPPEVPGSQRLERERDGVLRLLEGYVVGRLAQGDRPLLAVIGGPTGAGKSTLLNSLVGAPVSPASVLRPTTRTPVLLYNPVDEQALMSQTLLPGLELTTRRDEIHPAGRDDPTPPRRVQLVGRPEVPPGLAVLDSPDLDSWLSTNRELAAELLGIADLWIFVTTGTDYANAVPWDLLDGATERRVTIAAVLNRMRPNETTAVRQHFAKMLTERGMRTTPVFTIPELALVDDRIPYEYVGQLINWLSQQSGVHDVRESYLDRAVEGTLDQVVSGVRRLIEVATEQSRSEHRLRTDIHAVFTQTRVDLRSRVTGGVLTEGLREPWREVTEATHGGGLLRRLNAALRTPDTPYAAVGSVLRTSLIALVGQHVSHTLGLVAERWRNGPLTIAPGGTVHLPADFAARADTVVVAWMDGIEERVGTRSDRHSAWSRWSPEAVAVATLTVTVPNTAPDGLGPAALARRTLSERDVSISNADLDTVQAELTGRFDRLLSEEESRLIGILDSARAAAVDAHTLRAHLEALQRLKQAAFND